MSYAFPKTAEKEISFILYNYEKIDKQIDKRKNDLIDTINNSKTICKKNVVMVECYM